jgi:hypothetical protein
VRQLTQHVAHVQVAGPTSTQLARHARGEQPMLFELDVVLADEAPLPIMGGHPFPEPRAQGMNDIDKTLSGWGHDTNLLAPGGHKLNCGR